MAPSTAITTTCCWRPVDRPVECAEASPEPRVAGAGEAAAASAAADVSTPARAAAPSARSRPTAPGGRAASSAASTEEPGRGAARRVGQAGVIALRRRLGPEPSVPPATAPTVCASSRAEAGTVGQPAAWSAGVGVSGLVAVPAPASRRRPARRRGRRAAGSGPACRTAPGRASPRARARPAPKSGDSLARPTTCPARRSPGRPWRAVIAARPAGRRPSATATQRTACRRITRRLSLPGQIVTVRTSRSCSAGPRQPRRGSAAR